MLFIKVITSILSSGNYDKLLYILTCNSPYGFTLNKLDWELLPYTIPTNFLHHLCQTYILTKILIEVHNV